MEDLLNYEEWLTIHEDNITAELAEAGADREYGFNIEIELEYKYQQYLLKNV